MTQDELYREIAHVTGEATETIAALGFSLMVMPPPPVIVDHRVRLRQRTRRRLKARETPARKRRTATSPAKAPGNVPTRRTAA